MAKITGACLSFKATKTLGKTIIFQGSKRGTRAYFYHKPGSKTPFIPSVSQETQKTSVAALVLQWQNTQDCYKTDWEELAQKSGMNIAGYHYFMHKKGLGGPTPPRSLFRRQPSLRLQTTNLINYEKNEAASLIVNAFFETTLKS